MKLTIRIKTAGGPRTLVTSGHDAAVANSIKLALNRISTQAMEPDAIYAEVSEDGPVLSMREHMRRRKMAAVRASAKAEKAIIANSNVTPIRKKVK